MKNILHRAARWLAQKSAPAAITGSQWTGTSYTDSYKRNRNPSPNELMAELKGIAWACASLNSSMCANYPPRLYVTTGENQPAPKCATKALSRKTRDRFESAGLFKGVARIEEVSDHALIDLLAQPTPGNVSFGSFDLWETTQLYLEVHGKAYWYLEPGPYGVPQAIWVLPAQNVTPRRRPGSPNVVDYYSYQSGGKAQDFEPEEVVFFRYPDPRDPYLGGISPLRACYEQVAIASHYSARKQAIFENDAIPSAVISPDEVIGEEERDRLEAQWNAKMKRGGAGKVIVAESAMKVNVLSHSLGDLAQLAEMGANRDLIANAFHCPTAFFTTQTNMANLQASTIQHMQQAVSPRLTRRDQKLNESLVPLFDPSGRLFLASEDPTPIDAALAIQTQESDIKYGVVTINEIRGERGLRPVPWGDKPWLPMQWAQTDYAGRVDQDITHSPNVGRNKPSKPQKETENE